MNRYIALKHAVKAHAGELDKCDRPAILHPIAVADAIERDWTLIVRSILLPLIDKYNGSLEGAINIALLHDVLEDTDYEISADWLSDTEWNALYAVTRQPGEQYFDYIRRIIAAGPIAMLVKLADLWHNLQPERQNCLPKGEAHGLEKRYLKTRQMIWDALDFEWWPA
jgi:(p)ppGpp synthase/HD superfamily hydrolase